MNIPDKKVRKCCDKCAIYGGLTHEFLQCGNRVCKCHAPAVEVSKCCGKCAGTDRYTNEVCCDEPCPCHAVAVEGKEGECKNCQNLHAGSIIKATADLKNCGYCGRKLFDFPSKKEEQGDWEEELYFGVLEDLLFHQKMLPHHRNQKEGMDEIRQDIEKLKDFIRHQLQTARQDTKNEIIEEILKMKKSVKFNNYDYGNAVSEEDIISLLKGK